MIVGDAGEAFKAHVPARDRPLVISLEHQRAAYGVLTFTSSG